MINLKFTARRIAELEEEKGQSLLNLVNDIKLSTLALFISKGANIDEDDAYDQIDNYLSGGDKEPADLMLDIMEMVQRDGFLSKTIDIQTIRELGKQKESEVKKRIQKESVNIGKKTKS